MRDLMPRTAEACGSADDRTDSREVTHSEGSLRRRAQGVPGRGVRSWEEENWGQ